MELLEKRFGEQLRKIRTSRGISQDDLALITDLSRSYVSKIDRGQGNVSLKTLYKLAEALEVEPSDLLPS
jgi:transcriptional regulator with XRE-family HTH domain